MLSQSYTSKKAKSSQIEQSEGIGNQFYPGNDYMRNTFGIAITYLGVFRNRNFREPGGRSVTNSWHRRYNVKIDFFSLIM